jgi:hypothetical protein
LGASCALGAGVAALSAFAATGAAALWGAVFRAVRLSRQAVISSASLFFRSVNFAITALILAMALSLCEGAAFFAAALAAGLAALAGGFTAGGADAFLGAAFFRSCHDVKILCY